MKASFLALVFAALAVASPVALVPRQATGTTANEFLDDGCREVIFIFARGSIQEGNMGDQPGPQTSDGLKSALGTTNVATQGVDYAALLSTNLLPGGCSPADAATMRNLIAQAASQCPTSKIVVAGYSQGAALVHRALESLATSAQNQVVAAVTFGDTQKQQDNNQIPNFPTSKTLILCNDGDEVCDGTLIITAAHLNYTDKVPQAVSFMLSKI